MEHFLVSAQSNFVLLLSSAKTVSKQGYSCFLSRKKKWHILSIMSTHFFTAFQVFSVD